MQVVDVTFTKEAGRRYFLAVVRERGVELAPRQGPGYHDYLPHDAVHLIVESEAGLSGGVFGRIAAGQSNIFSAADASIRRRVARREARRSVQPNDRADMERSEALASMSLLLWELRSGHPSELPAWVSRVNADLLDSPLIERILARLDEFAMRWHALPVGSGVTLHWEPSRSRTAPQASGTRLRRTSAAARPRSRVGSRR